MLPDADLLLSHALFCLGSSLLWIAADAGFRLNKQQRLEGRVSFTSSLSASSAVKQLHSRRSAGTAQHPEPKCLDRASHVLVASAIIMSTP